MVTKTKAISIIEENKFANKIAIKVKILIIQFIKLFKNKIAKNFSNYFRLMMIFYKFCLIGD